MRLYLINGNVFIHYTDRYLVCIGTKDEIDQMDQKQLDDRVLESLFIAEGEPEWAKNANGRPQ